MCHRVGIHSMLDAQFSSQLHTASSRCSLVAACPTNQQCTDQPRIQSQSAMYRSATHTKPNVQISHAYKAKAQVRADQQVYLFPSASPRLQVPVAIAAWRGLLEGRFRLLERWCAFMSSAYKAIVVTEDTWTQVGRAGSAVSITVCIECAGASQSLLACQHSRRAHVSCMSLSVITGMHRTV
jgi:hypothetical protein